MLDALAAIGFLYLIYAMIAWTIGGSGPLVGRLRRGGLADELLGWLRSEYGFGPPAAWSVSLEVERSAPLPAEWYEQETIRGDFLREIRRLQVNPSEPPDLAPYMCESHLAGTLASAAELGEGAGRECVLSEAALLGAELLSGEEDQP